MHMSAMRWTGGKSAASPTGTGRWIAGLLPPPSECDLYVEPFAGMLGVLLQRTPAAYEIVNDLDDRIVNWWTVVRDQPDELARMIAFTPHSRTVFERARADGQSDPLLRALDFTVSCLQAMDGRAGAKARWAPCYGVIRDWRRGLPDALAGLSARMANVQIEACDAVDLLERVAGKANAVVYVDPPYAGTVGYDGAYAHVDDRARLTAALRAQMGRVAVSGYGTEWDELGWQRHEHGTYTPMGSGEGVPKTGRTEVCWTNYETAQRTLALEGAM